LQVSGTENQFRRKMVHRDIIAKMALATNQELGYKDSNEIYFPPLNRAQIPSVIPTKSGPEAVKGVVEKERRRQKATQLRKTTHPKINTHVFHTHSDGQPRKEWKIHTKTFSKYRKIDLY